MHKSTDNEHENTHYLCERIRSERERLKLSQQEVADLTGVRREMWGRYERGAAIPSAEILERFSAHGADAQYLLTGSRATTTSLNEMLLRDVIEALEEALAGAGKTMRPSSKAQVIAALYNMYSDSESSVTVDKRAVLTLVKSA